MTNSIIPLLFTTVLFMSCADPQITQGGGMETTNGIHAISPNEHSVVQLRPSNFDPIKNTEVLFSDTILKNQKFHIPLPKEGSYTLTTRSVHRPSFSSIYSFSVKRTDSTINIPPTPLYKSGAIKVSLQKDHSTPEGYFYIPGTSIITHITQQHINQQHLYLKDIPHGQYSEIIFKKNSTSIGYNILPHEIHISPEESVVIYEDTSTSQTQIIHIQTHSLTESLRHFPLLIKVQGTKFLFSKQLDENQNIAFTNLNGTTLNHHIAHWNPSTKTAHFWVLIDSLSSTYNPSIQMHHGTHIRNLSHLSAFNHKNHFAAAYHFEKPSYSASAQEVHTDISPNSFHGVIYTNDETTTGIVGNGQGFNGNGDYIQLPPSSSLFPTTTSAFSVSGWFKLSSFHNSTTSFPSRLFSLYSDNPSDIVNGEKQSALSLGIDRFGKLSTYPSQSKKTTIPHSLSLNTWYYFTWSNNFEGSSIYLNGNLIITLPPISLQTGNSPGKLGIFSSSLLPSFHGVLDEFRFSIKDRSQEWIRFSYQMQKENTSIVTIED